MNTKADKSERKSPKAHGEKKTTRRPSRKRHEPVPLDAVDNQIIRRILHQPTITAVQLASEIGLNVSTIKERWSNPTFKQQLQDYQRELTKDALTILSEGLAKAARRMIGLIDAKKNAKPDAENALPDSPIQFRSSKFVLANLPTIAAALAKPKADSTGETLSEYGATELDGLSRYAALVAERKAADQGGAT